MRCSVIRELDKLEDFLIHQGQLRCSVIQGLDFSELSLDWNLLDVTGVVFLGCTFPENVTIDYLIQHGAVIFPNLPDLPYMPYRAQLYTREELMHGWTRTNDQSADKQIYDHFVERGRAKPDILESLSQRLHDHAIDDGLRDLLEGRIEGDGAKKVVAIMGGHGTPRTDHFYKKVVKLSRDLTRAGYYIASGGGPGTMEAANLGAWLAGVDDAGLEEVFAILATAPDYSHPEYMQAAQRVLDLHPDGYSSVAIPTWFYGHEPTNLFSKRVAKFFSNSVREDGLLAIAEYGVVFAPGSAGTTQEIFMDATQNHYVSYGKVSPMVFLGEKRYTQDTMIYPCIQQLAAGRTYADMLHCTDDIEDAVDFIISHPPFAAQG